MNYDPRRQVGPHQQMLMDFAKRNYITLNQAAEAIIFAKNRGIPPADIEQIVRIAKERHIDLDEAAGFLADMRYPIQSISNISKRVAKKENISLEEATNRTRHYLRQEISNPTGYSSYTVQSKL